MDNWTIEELVVMTTAIYIIILFALYDWYQMEEELRRIGLKKIPGRNIWTYILHKLKIGGKEWTE